MSERERTWRIGADVEDGDVCQLMMRHVSLRIWWPFLFLFLFHFPIIYLFIFWVYSYSRKWEKEARTLVYVAGFIL